MNQQSLELLERAKVIEELKNSLTVIMDKYTKLKTELDKQKQYGLQLSTSLRQAQKKKTRTMSSYRAVINSTSSNFGQHSLFRITHFSHYFARSTVKKKIKVQIEDNNEMKKMKEELEDLKKNFENKENSYIGQINIINKEMEKLKTKNESYEEKIKEIKRKKNMEIEKEKSERKRALDEILIKNKNETERLNNEINKLKDENNLYRNDNNNVKEIKSLLEDYKKKNKR